MFLSSSKCFKVLIIVQKHYSRCRTSFPTVQSLCKTPHGVLMNICICRVYKGLQKNHFQLHNFTSKMKRCMNMRFVESVTEDYVKFIEFKRTSVESVLLNIRLFGLARTCSGVAQQSFPCSFSCNSSSTKSQRAAPLVKLLRSPEKRLISVIDGCGSRCACGFNMTGSVRVPVQSSELMAYHRNVLIFKLLFP